MGPNSWQAPRQNVELKARLRDLERARRLAIELSGDDGETLRQTDTYFHCRHGRLKLREIEGGTSQLIAYARGDRLEPRASEYHLVPVADPAALRAALADTLGLLTIVRKVREFFLYNNVRIHLDQVESLGSFLEFEAVLDRPEDFAAGERQVRDLAREFAIEVPDLVATSYSELLLSIAHGSTPRS